MKRLYLLIIPAVLFVLGGCATPIENTGISKFTHADIQNAVKIDTAAASATNDPTLKAAFTARAGVWSANDQLLSMWEKQIDACGQSILALKPSIPDGTIGAASAFEIAAITVAMGGSAAAKLACEPAPIPALPVFPKIP